MEEEEELDVVVIGGGVGGCALGIMLARCPNIRFAVFERDLSFSERSQGYGLTIQHHDALKILGLEDQVRAEDTVNDAHFIFGPQGDLCSVFGRFLDVVSSRKGVACHNGDAGKRYNVHLPRQRLRHLLLEQLAKEAPPQAMQWGWRLDKIREEESVAHLVFNSRHSSQVRRIRARLVVGADGIHSCVRSAKCAREDRRDDLQYLGMLVVLGMTPSEHPLGLKTTFQTLDGTTRLFTMPFTAASTDPETGEKRGFNSTFWQLSFPCAHEEAKHLKANLPALRAEIWKRCHDWHEPVPELLRDAPDHMITATPVYDRGEAYPFLRQGPACAASCLTLIGDAAHPMSPFKGQGANQALLDGVLLGEELNKLFGKEKNPSTSQLLKLVERVEKKMYERSEKKVEGSRAVAIRLHTTAAAHDPATRGISEDMVKLFKEKNLGAHTQDLRSKVIDCVKEVKDAERNKK